MFKNCFWTITVKKIQKYFLKKEVIQSSNFHSRVLYRRHPSEKGTLHTHDNQRLTSSLHYRCPWGSNSSWTIIISTSVATEVSVYWSLTRKNNTKIFVGFFFFKFLLWNTVFSIGSRKQYAFPREEEPKWKWRAIVTSCFIAVCQYAITKNEEIGTTVDLKIQRKTTEQFLNPHPKATFHFPHKLHTFLQCSATKPLRSRRTEQWLVGEHALSLQYAILTLLHTTV